MIKRLLIFYLLFCLLLTGCIGLRYQVGAKSLFGQDIRTVYVPVFKSDNSRRDLAERLTEAVCKRIEARSTYKVVNRPTADSTLEGEILDRTKSANVINNYSDPREIIGVLNVQVKWQDRRHRDLRSFDAIPWNDGSGRASASAFLVAEHGQSELTTEQQQIDTVADQIVGMMETPW
jgi:hypothetical protein